MKHEHTPSDEHTTPGSPYQICECGAVRRAARPGVPADAWHICATCAPPAPQEGEGS